MDHQNRNLQKGQNSRSSSKRNEAYSNGNERYSEACAKIQKSVENYLQKFDQDDESEDEEEELEENKIIETISKAYAGKELELLLSSRTHQYLTDSLKSGLSVCLICIETVKRPEATWSCFNCYSLFHLVCIQKWARDSIQLKELNQETNNDATQVVFWCCPKCRQEYDRGDCPSKYKCFCQKVIDPEPDPWTIPHSCGEICDKNLDPFCGHKCLLLCHPGPCPPCPKTITITCFCGAGKPQARRCSASKWSCEKKCRRTLECGQHKCESMCHEGECLPCSQESVQPCDCEQSKTVRPCINRNWKCDRKCGKELSCGFHTCEIVCHSGSCGNCPRSGKRACPCGKAKFDLPCTEDVSVCGSTCGNKLECGMHECFQRCHLGACSKCFQMTSKVCRCGLREKTVPCSQEYICDTKCKKQRECRRHACNKKCCDGFCPPCEQTCNRTLGCKNHKCSSRCHSGACYPCPLQVKIPCRCESTTIAVPCGREKFVKPPKCKKLCNLVPKCDHEKPLPHRCHFGECPPCRQICEKTYSDCGHLCTSVCHISVLTKIVPEQQKQAAFWERAPPAYYERVSHKCPPCMELVPMVCPGEHETRSTPCSDSASRSCGRLCGRRLTCGNHTCKLECHKVLGSLDQIQAGENCSTCEEMCSKPRPAGCSHKCIKACHPGQCPSCQQRFRLRCHCQINMLYLVCCEWFKADENKRKDMLCCQNKCPKELPCGHRCSFLCHPGDCATPDKCKKKATMYCPCKRIKKDVTCNLRNQMIPLICDEICMEEKEKAAVLEKEKQDKKRQEKEKQQAKELEEFHKKMEGRKKRRKKRDSETVAEVSWWKTKVGIGALSSAVVFVATLVYYIFLK